jgi:transcriptional regulator with XRE-family HTH domain
LLDEPRPGAPRRISDAQVEQMVTVTLEAKPREATHWSTRAMAARCGLSQSTVSRIWRAFGLQPRRTEAFKLSKTPLIRRWLSKRPRFHRHLTPHGASWINLVERWFATLTEKQIRRGVHRSTRALEAAIIKYIAVTNEQPRPFRWTKTADEILASVERFCRRISDSRD